MTSSTTVPPSNPICQATVLASASTAALVTFLVYTSAVFILAGLAHRVLSQRKFLSEYFLGSRGLGVIGFTLTYGATSASAGSFAGFPARIYTHGWVLALWIASYMIVPLCGLGLFGKRFNQVARKTNAITIPEMLGRRFESRSLALLATCLIIFLLSFYLIPQFKVASYILRTLLADVPVAQQASAALGRLTTGIVLFDGVDPEYLFCLVLFTVLTVFYTTFGGFRAVVWTDVLQGCVMLAGVLIMLALALYQVGGLSRATQKLSRMIPPELGTAHFIVARPPDADLRIDTDTWFSLSDTEAGYRLFRTNELAVIPGGRLQSNEVKVVRIMTPEEIADIRARFEGGQPPPLPPSISAKIDGLRPYAYGQGQRGTYVTGPGPSRDTGAGFLPLGLAVSFFLFWTLSGTGQAGNLMRLMTFDSARTLRRSIALLSVYFAIIYFPLVIIFCCARVLVPGLDQDPDRIMPKMALTLATGANIPWLAGVLVAAPFAAAMSTVDSFTLMISASAVRDVYQPKINPNASARRLKGMSYLCTLIVGVVVSLGAVNPPQYLQDMIVFTGGALSVSFLFPVGLALYWRRFNAPGALAAMIGGFTSYLLLCLSGFVYYGAFRPLRPFALDPLIWGLAGSLACGLFVTLFTAPPPRHLVRRFFYVDSAD